MPKAAFIVFRSNYFKHFGPLVQGALARGWQVVFFALQVSEEDEKYYLRVDKDTLPDFGESTPSVHFFLLDEGYAHLIESQRPDVVFSLHARNLLSATPPAHSHLHVNIQHNLDSFLEGSLDDLCQADMFCFQADYWIDFGAEYFSQAEGIDREAAKVSLQEKAVTTGGSQYDVFAQLDRVNIRKKFGIPQDKKVVLYYPVNLKYWPDAWSPMMQAPAGLSMWRELLRATKKDGLQFFLKYWRWALMGWNDAALTRAVRKFCDFNDAYLIIKGREKDPFRDAAGQVADLIAYDQGVYPATSHELIAAADMVIHFYSTAALEAAAAGVFGLTLHRPSLEILAHQLWRTNKTGTAYNFPGVNTWLDIPQFIQRAQTLPLSQFEIEADAREAFLRQFTGLPGSADNILDEVATRL